MSKFQLIGTATQPQSNRKFGQFNKDQDCTVVDELTMYMFKDFTNKWTMVARVDVTIKLSPSSIKQNKH